MISKITVCINKAKLCIAQSILNSLCRKTRSQKKRGKRRRSRSRSRSRDRRGKRRSRSRDRDDRKRKQDEDKRDFEKQEERKKKGFPPVKEGYLTLCSTTLWVGHLSKLVQQEDLSDTFGTYGEVRKRLRMLLPPISLFHSDCIHRSHLTSRLCLCLYEQTNGC